MSSLRVSIITVVYNGARFLETTMRSVLEQSHGNIEYIVLDGGSTDGSVEIIKKYADRLAYWESCRDGGMYDALAKGLKRVTGDVCAYINADDFYSPTAVEGMVRIFEKFPEVKWVTGMNVGYSVEGFMVEASVPFQYRRELIAAGAYGVKLPFIQQEGIFWRRELNDLVDLERLAKLRLAGDYFLWRSFAAGGNELFVVPMYVGGIRKHGGQLSAVDKASGKKSGMERYLDEMRSVAGGRLGLCGRMKCWWDNFCWRLPVRVKARLAKRWIWYDLAKGDFCLKGRK